MALFGLEFCLSPVNQTGSYIQPTQPLSTAQILVQSSHLLLEHEQQIKRLERTLENQAESISQIKDSTPPEGYKVASSCYSGIYKLHYETSSIVCTKLSKDGHSWTHPTTGEIYYDVEAFLNEVALRIENGEFSNNQKAKLNHVWQSCKPQPEAAKTKTRKPAKCSIDSLLEEYLEGLKGKEAAAAYGKLYRATCTNVGISGIKMLNSLVEASTFKNKKQYLMNNYPIQLKNVLTSLLRTKTNSTSSTALLRRDGAQELVNRNQMTDIYSHLDFDSDVA